MITVVPEATPTNRLTNRPIERTGGTTYRCQGHCTHIIAHNHSIGGVVELLEKGAQQDREEECQQRAEDPCLR